MLACLNNKVNKRGVTCHDRDAVGRIVKPAPFQSRLTSGTVARVEPNRRWFGECHSAADLVYIIILHYITTIYSGLSKLKLW